MQVVCDTCGKEFDKMPCKIKKTNYCSTTCHYSRKYERITVTCEVCHKEFTKKPSHAARTQNHYCSVNCTNKGFHLLVHHYDENGNLIEKKCSLCSRWLAPKDFWAANTTQSKLGSACIKCQKMKRYNLTDDEYDAIFFLGKCATCGTTNDLCIDHDHETGDVRNLLCRKCNTILGLSEDNPVVLRALAKFIEDHKTKG